MASFIKSAVDTNGWINDDFSEVCFVGRSNVGKSSLINALAQAKIAFISKTPGRTQMINFYDFNKFRLVDLPGYGYAKVNKEKKESIYNLIYNYIHYRTNLRMIFLIVDANVITEADKDMIDVLKKKYRNVFVIANKVDKLSNNLQANLLTKISKYLNVNLNDILLISCKNKINIKEVHQLILKHI